MIQDPSRLLLDLDVINDIFPRKDSGLPLDDPSIRSVSTGDFLLHIRATGKLAAFNVVG